MIQVRVDRFVRRCRQKGLKITPQRLEIFRTLASTGEHPTAEELFRRIKTRMPTLSLDTVYRTLTTLQGQGLLARVEVLDDRSRFDCDVDPHHHFVCVRCRQVQDCRWPGFEAVEVPPEAGDWGKVDGLHIELRGRCRQCLASAGETGPGGL